MTDDRYLHVGGLWLLLVTLTGLLAWLIGIITLIRLAHWLRGLLPIWHTHFPQK